MIYLYMKKKTNLAGLAADRQLEAAAAVQAGGLPAAQDEYLCI